MLQSNAIDQDAYTTAMKKTLYLSLLLALTVATIIGMILLSLIVAQQAGSVKTLALPDGLLFVALGVMAIIAVIVLTVIVALHMGPVKSYVLSGGLEILGLKINGAVRIDAPTTPADNAQ